MNVSRRGFLGSILGTYIATQAPWFARSPLFRDPQGRSQEYGFLLELLDGTQIKGPLLKRHGYNVLLQCFEFEAEPVIIQRPMTIAKSILLDARGDFLFGSPFSEGSVSVLPQDKLSVTNKVTDQFMAKTPPGKIEFAGPGRFSPEGRNVFAGLAYDVGLPVNPDLMTRASVSRRRIIKPR